MFPGISVPETMVILLVALLLFGPKSIPRLARRMGEWARVARRAMDDIRSEFNDLRK